MTKFNTYINLVMENIGHTLWLKPSGEYVNIPTGGPTHYSWIAQNFAKLFPNEQFTDSNVFDIPIKYGWIHIRNHWGSVDISGTHAAINGQKRHLKKLLEDISMEDDDKNVGIDFYKNDGNPPDDRSKSVYGKIKEVLEKFF